MSRNKSSFAMRLGVFALGSTFLSVAFFLAAPAGQPSLATAIPTASPQSGRPVALVKSIVVDGALKVQAAESELKVTRTSGKTERAETGMRLFADDEVFTGPKVQSTLLFLEDAAERNNEVVLDEKTHIQVGSVYNWFGRIILRVRNTFATKTEKVKLGVQGTEYQLEVKNNGDNRITVLEGVVTVEKGSFSPSATLPPLEASPASANNNSGVYLRSSFTQELLPARQRIAYQVKTGQKSTVKWRHTFNNACNKQLTYELQGPQKLSWFRILKGKRVDVKVGKQEISFDVEIDATKVPVGTYDGVITVSCSKCQGCNAPPRFSSVQVNVLKVELTPGEEKTVQAGKQEAVTVTATRLEKQSAPEGVRQAVAWSNEAIILSHPSYAAPSTIPHFRDAQERARAFQQARLDAALNGNPLSYLTLGDVYLDWGNAAKAIEAYERSGKIENQTTADFLSDLAEAHRLAGHLQEAEGLLNKALAQNSKLGRALNALGNVYMDQARVEQDKHHYISARTMLEKAQEKYAQASSAETPVTKLHHQTGRAKSLSTPPRITDKGIIQSNLGEVLRAFGDIARVQGRGEEALGYYQDAKQVFSQAQQLAPRYPFAHTGMGDVYRGINRVVAATGDKSGAADAFALAEMEFTTALKQHKDLVPGYIGLGVLYENTGSKDAAINFYTAATQSRPEAPSGHDHLATAVAERDPRLAAEHRAVYLALEPAGFRQSVRAQNWKDRVDSSSPLVAEGSKTPPKATGWGGLPGNESKVQPTDIVLGTDSHSDKYGEVPFSHENHAKRNYEPAGTAVLACTECHHTDQPAAALKPPLETSERDAILTAALLQAADSRRVRSCRSCHLQAGDDRAPLPAVTYPDTTRPTKLTNEVAYHKNCSTCHDKALGARPALRGKAPGLQDCLLCHKSAQ